MDDSYTENARGLFVGLAWELQDGHILSLLHVVSLASLVCRVVVTRGDVNCSLKRGGRTLVKIELCVASLNPLANTFTGISIKDKDTCEQV